MPESAWLTGQFSFAAAAIFWKSSSLMPGI